MINLDLFGLVVIGAVFGAYLLGVQLVEMTSVRLRSITFIKSLHLLVFFAVTGLLAGLVYEVILGRITILTWITIAVFLAEGVVLKANRGRCPLTAIAESLGSAHGQVTDIFLPKWFADRAFVVYTWMFAASVVVLGIRLLA